MPRYRPAPPPEPSELVALSLHVLVRDWPELDPLLQAAGVDLVAAGHLTLGEVLGRPSPSQALSQSMSLDQSGTREGAGKWGAPAAGVLLDQMAAATRWRSDPPS